MKINIDCMREVLLFLEKNLTAILIDNDTAIEFNCISALDISKGMPHFKKEDVWYSLKMLAECDYIDINGIQGKDYFSMLNVESMTYQGHKFLESIRPQSVWNKTKSIISKVGSHTLGFVEDTAQKIAIEYAKSLINSVPINTPSTTQ